MRGDGALYKPAKSRFWWASFYVDGVRYRMSTKETVEHRARRVLRRKVGEALAGIAPPGRRLSVADLLEHVRADYLAKRRRSTGTLKFAFRHLLDFFGNRTPVTRVTTEAVDRYIHHRRAEGAAESTIRTEVHLLSRSFRLAVRARRWSDRLVPYVPLVPPDPSRIRQGFLTLDEVEAVCGELGDDFADLVRFLFYSAWRVSEARSLEWRDYDPDARAFRLRAERSKTGHPRLLPVAGAIAPIVERRLAKRDSSCPYVFHRRAGRNGAKRRVPIGDFRKVWSAACRAVGLEGRIVHDLRRSGIKHMAELGIDHRRIMALSGHRTIATFHRYQIADVTSLKSALDLVARRAVRQRRRHTAAAESYSQAPRSPRT